MGCPSLEVLLYTPNKCAILSLAGIRFKLHGKHLRETLIHVAARGRLYTCLLVHRMLCYINLRYVLVFSSWLIIRWKKQQVVLQIVYWNIVNDQLCSMFKETSWPKEEQVGFDLCYVYFNHITFYRATSHMIIKVNEYFINVSLVCRQL